MKGFREVQAMSWRNGVMTYIQVYIIKDGIEIASPLCKDKAHAEKCLITKLGCKL